jgi:UDP:flavonoid glycosyltransferase YjiC (YdhE family)
LLARVLRGLALSGQRAILNIGARGLDRSLPASVYPLGWAPHGWLFPRLSAAVHHGGAGTVAAAMLAGIPSICVPFGADQFFWGSRVARLKCGPTPIPARRLTAKRLAEAIDLATRERIFKLCAARLAEQIGAEQGVERAVALIDAHLEYRR